MFNFSGLKGRWPWLLNAAVVLVTVGVSLACRLALDPILGYSSPFMFFLVAILISGWLGGLGTALTATVLSALAASYFYLAPIGSLRLAGLQEVIHFISFLVLGAIVSLIVSRLRKDRARAEQARREAQESQQRLGGIVESAMDAIMSIDEEQKIVLFNSSAEKMFRCPAAEALGSPLDRFIPERFRAIHRQHVRIFGETAQTARAMGHLRPLSALRNDGEEFPIEASISQVQVAGQKIFTVILRDVTQRVRAEAALRQSEAQLKTIVENLSEGLIVSDLDGNLRHWNRAALEQHGFASLEECCRSVSELADSFELATMDGRVLPAGQRPLARILNGEVLRDLDLCIRRPAAGWERIFSFNGTIVRDETGQPLMAVVTINDVTERKRTETELERRVRERTAQLQETNERLETLNAKLEVSNRELQDFAFVASHDLQEPLRKIMAFGDILKSEYGPALNEPGADYLGRMQSAANRMQTLINDLLQFSRVTSKAQPFATVDLKQAAEAVLSDLEVRLQQSGASVEVGDLPTLEADPLQMRQLLQNLIGNAIKFARPGEPPRVRVYAEPEPAPERGRLESRRVRLYVADNGIGFEEKYLDRIFTVFQRLHGRGEYEGTGIGLAICRKIVERHGGSITARSRPGAGSTFIVTLPLSQTPRRSGNGA